MGCGSSSDCGGCPSQSSGCGGGASQQPQDLTAQLHELSSVKHVIGVVSGKGGVGKSLSLIHISCESRCFSSCFIWQEI